MKKLMWDENSYKYVNNNDKYMFWLFTNVYPFWDNILFILLSNNP